jgi:hypoxia up-regulated 1
MFGFRRKKPAFVPKEKKRTLKKTLGVVIYYVGKVQPYSAELLAESQTKMAELDHTDEERIKLEAAKNQVESYIYLIKNKLIDDEENVNKVTTEEQRESLRSMGVEAEDWLYDDGYNADYPTMVAKHLDLSSPAEKVWFRVRELTARPAAVEALKAKLDKIPELMKKWETSSPQVTEEEKAELLVKVEEVKAWIAEKEAAQAEVAAHEDPVFTSEEVPLQTKPIEKLIHRLSKKPKPKVVKEKKNETDAEAGNETDAGAETADLDAEEMKADAEETKAEETKADAEEPKVDAEEAKEEASEDESESPKLEAEEYSEEEL